MSAKARSFRWAAIAVASLAVGAMVIPASRTAVLRSAGRILVTDDPVGTADMIVITIEGGGAAVLEAADLVHQGMAAKVAVFADPGTDSVDREFTRRGIPYEDGAARAIRQLGSLGVTDVQRIPRTVAGTEDEGLVLPGWCDQQRLRSIIVIGTSDHSRRLHRVLHRALTGHQTRAVVRFGRYSTFDPDRWWETRFGIRTEIIELEKLVLDVARHPFS